jgi:hypothetical protein
VTFGSELDQVACNPGHHLQRVDAEHRLEMTILVVGAAVDLLDP